MVKSAGLLVYGKNNKVFQSGFDDRSNPEKFVKAISGKKYYGDIHKIWQTLCHPECAACIAVLGWFGRILMNSLIIVISRIVV